MARLRWFLCDLGPALGLAALVVVAAVAVRAAPAAAPDSAVAVAGAPAPPLVRFEWEGQAGRAAAAVCAAALREGGGDLAAALVPPGRVLAPIRCLLLPTAGFRALAGGRLPDWGIGAAMPGGLLIALDVQRPALDGRGLREIFLHELAHAVIDQVARGRPLPAWFQEGAAQRLSGEWRFRDGVALILGGAIPDLSRLDGRFPANAVWADQAYRASLLAVQALEREQGPGVIGRIVARVGEGENFYDAFAAVTGEDVDVFGRRFGRTVRFRFGWLVVLTRWPLLFVVLALLFLVGAAARLAGRRRRLRAMPDDEDEPEAGGELDEDGGGGEAGWFSGSSWFGGPDRSGDSPGPADAGDGPERR